MNTIAIDPNLYKEAQVYATGRGKTLTEMVENYLKSVMRKVSRPSYQMKSVEELPGELQQLIGLAKSDKVNPDDLNGTATRLEHINKKYQ